MKILFVSALISASIVNSQAICREVSVSVPEIVNERNFECSGNFVNPRFAWQWNDADGDEYRVQVRDGSQNLLYQTQELFTSDSEIGVTLQSLNRYQVRLTCENEVVNCLDITFSYAIVDCGCSGVQEEVEACITTGSIANMRSAVCATPSSPLSDEPVQGRWVQLASGPGVAYQSTITYTTEQGTVMTEEQQESFSASVSVGFNYGAVSGEVEVGAEFSNAASQSISTTFSETSSSTISIACPDISVSTTGQWFVWQWGMEVEQDNSGGVGATVTTRNFVCTSSFPEEPRCPLGYCADVICQTCLLPFDGLSLRVDSITTPTMPTPQTPTTPTSPTTPTAPTPTTPTVPTPTTPTDPTTESLTQPSKAHALSQWLAFFVGLLLVCIY